MLPASALLGLVALTSLRIGIATAPARTDGDDEHHRFWPAYEAAVQYKQLWGAWLRWGLVPASRTRTVSAARTSPCSDVAPCGACVPVYCPAWAVRLGASSASSRHSVLSESHSPPPLVAPRRAGLDPALDVDAAAAAASTRGGAARNLQSCAPGSWVCGTGSCAGCCSLSCDSCTCTTCTQCQSSAGQTVNAIGVYVGVSLTILFFVILIAVCCQYSARRRRMAAAAAAAGAQQQQVVMIGGAPGGGVVQIGPDGMPLTPAQQQVLMQPYGGAPPPPGMFVNPMASNAHGGGAAALTPGEAVAQLAAALTSSTSPHPAAVMPALAAVAGGGVKWPPPGSPQAEALASQYWPTGCNALRWAVQTGAGGAPGVELAARAVALLSGSPDARAQAGGASSDTVPLLLGLLRAPPSTPAVENACDALTQLMVDPGVARGVVLPAGAVGMAASGLGTVLSWPPGTLGAPEAAGAWARLLAAAAAVDPGAVAAAGAVGPVMQLVGSQGVGSQPAPAALAAGCRVLGALASCDDAVPALAAAGAGGAVASALAGPALGGDPSLRRDGMRALAALARPPALRGAIAAAGGEALLAAAAVDDGGAPGTADAAAAGLAHLRSGGGY